MKNRSRHRAPGCLFAVVLALVAHSCAASGSKEFGTVAQSGLSDELEVKRANQNKEKLPEYPAPALEK